MPVTYWLEFELSYNTWSDLSADWHAPTPLRCVRGLAPGARVASTGRMRFALRNPDGRYTPGHAGALPGFEAGIGVRLRASDGSTSATLFTGRLASIRPRRAAGEPVADLLVEDEMAALARRELGVLRLWIDAAPRDVVRRLVEISFAPPGAYGRWRLAHPQAGALGQGAALAGIDEGCAYDRGQASFPWVGDTWGPETRARSALRDVCEAEGGSFHLRADGTPVFADRHARPKHITPEAEIGARLAGLFVEHARGPVVTRAEATVYPRAVGDSPETLWECGVRLRLRPGETRAITARYRDADGAPLGALSVEGPVPGLDYTASTSEDLADPLAVDVSESLHVRVEAGASSARVTLTNRWPGRDAVTVHRLALRGVALRSGAPVTLAAEDSDAGFAYGRGRAVLNLRLAADPAVGADLARAQIVQGGAPRPWLAITLDTQAGAGALAQALLRDVGDRLEVHEPGLGLDAAPCFIERVWRRIEGAGARQRVTWETSPADRYAVWLLGTPGYAALGDSARLGY